MAGSEIYLGRGNLVVCAAHRSLVTLVRPDPLDVLTLTYHALPPGCMVCATPPDPGRVCHREACAAPLHERWPGLYCSHECAWKDAL